jgi:hypothetical protein
MDRRIDPDPEPKDEKTSLNLRRVLCSLAQPAAFEEEDDDEDEVPLAAFNL